MEKRVIFGHDLFKRSSITELQKKLDRDEFYMGYAPGNQLFFIVRRDSILRVHFFPEEFYEDAVERYPVKKTVT